MAAPAIRLSCTNLGFQRTLAACRNHFPSLVLAMQQLGAAEPYSVSGEAANKWLLHKFNLKPALTAQQLAAVRKFTAELFGEEVAAGMFD